MPVRKNLCVQAYGNLAMWTRPDSTYDKVSYVAPPPGQIRGFVKSLYHKNLLEIVPIKVEILSPLETWYAGVSVQPWQTIQLPMSEMPVGGRPKKGQASLIASRAGNLFISRPRYRFYFDAYCNPSGDQGGSGEGEKMLARLERQLRDLNYSVHPCFGLKECMAFLEPVDQTPPANINVRERFIPLSNSGKQFISVEIRNGVLDYAPHYEAIRSNLLLENRNW